MLVVLQTMSGSAALWRLMTSCMKSGCGCSAWTGSAVASGQRAGIFGSTTRPTAAGGPDTALRPRDAATARTAPTADVEPGEPADRGADTSPSRSATRASAPGPSTPRWPRKAAVAHHQRQRACGGSFRGTASTAAARMSLVAGYAAPLEPERPGEHVGFDCFHVGRLLGTAGRVWQYMGHQSRPQLRLGRAGHNAAQPVGRLDLRPG